MSFIDHVAAAQAEMARTDPKTKAVVHALLAIQEQQRIGNLVALSLVAGNEHINECLAEAAYGALDQVIGVKLVPNGHCEPDEISVLADDVAAALGVKTS